MNEGTDLAISAVQGAERRACRLLGVHFTLPSKECIQRTECLTECTASATLLRLLLRQPRLLNESSPLSDDGIAPRYTMV